MINNVKSFFTMYIPTLETTPKLTTKTNKKLKCTQCLYD